MNIITPSGKAYEVDDLPEDDRSKELLNSEFTISLGVRIRRTHLIEDSLKSFQFVSDSDKRKTVQIHYSGEEGYDAGNFELRDSRL